MSERPLKPGEKKIWQHVAKTVSPRRRPKGKGSAKPLPSREDFATMLRIPPETSRETRPLPKTLDVNQDKRVRRGHIKIDRKIDLHDMTQDLAKATLHRAIMRASNRNHHCLSTIRPLIASYSPAHIKHGGSGAWYIFLKK